jgi:DNA invertase Pin-like site-specific DNA recombinase
MKALHVDDFPPAIEDVESGRNLNRDGIKRLIQLANSGEINYVFVANIDRLGRNTAETPYLMYRLKEVGVTVVDLNEKYELKNPVDYIIVAIKCYRADEERLRLLDRTCSPYVTKLANGIWPYPPSKKPPFGYKLNGKKIEVDLALVAIVEDIFRSFVQNPKPTKITLLIKTKYGEKAQELTKEAVRRILRNPLYMGTAQHGDLTEPAPKLRIIDPKLFDDVKQIIDEHRKELKQKYTSIDTFADWFGLDYLLRVLPQLKAICPECGGTMEDYGSRERVAARLRRSSRIEDVKLPKFRCKTCGVQRTIPEVHELTHFQDGVLSCPRCRNTQDFDGPTLTTDERYIKYTCKRCFNDFFLANYPPSELSIMKKRKDEWAKRD